MNINISFICVPGYNLIMFCIGIFMRSCNICSREVEHPAVISNFFAESDTIDRHIQSWQYDLAIKKAWVMKDCYFQLTCSMIRMHVTDSWKLAAYHNIINYTTKPTKGLWQYKDCRWFRLPVNYHFIIMLQVSFYAQQWSRKWKYCPNLACFRFIFAECFLYFW